MAALRRAEQIARAADLQVAQRQVEAGTKAAVFLQCRDTLARVFIHMPVLGQQQPRETFLRRTPDAPAELVEIRDPETVGAVHEHGVGARDVETALDNRGAEQHIDLSRLELAHDAGQCVRRHPAVGNRDACLRNQFFQPAFHQPDGHHAVVEEINLPAAVQLLADRAGDHRIRVACDLGLHRHAFLRRRLEQAHVARAGHTHVERARNRRGRKRQHVHNLPRQFQFLLVGYAETLFLVDDQQPQILERDLSRDQCVRADHDIDKAVPRVGKDPFPLGVRLEAADNLNFHGIGGHAVGKGLIVLLGQHGGRHEHGNLMAVHDRNERRTHGDLRLAVTRVTADQPVHRPRCRHVAFDLRDHLFLIGGFLIREGRFELMHPDRLGIEGESLHYLPPRLRVEQGGSEIGDSPFGVSLFACPALASEAVELDFVACHAHIAAQQMRVRNRNMELRALGIFDGENFRAVAVHLHLGGTEETPDAVVDMHHKVAGFEIGGIFHTGAA